MCSYMFLRSFKKQAPHFVCFFLQEMPGCDSQGTVLPEEVSSKTPVLMEKYMDRSV